MSTDKPVTVSDFIHRLPDARKTPHGLHAQSKPSVSAESDELLKLKAEEARKRASALIEKIASPSPVR